MSLDFNTANEQRSGDLIPEGTIVPVQLMIRPGNSGEGGWLKPSSTGSEGLDCEFTVLDGPDAKRKFWQLLTVTGDTDGQKKAAEISGSILRAMLESAFAINPKDQSQEANAKRILDCYADLNGLRFLVKVGIRKGDGVYKDKNVIAAVITPDRKEWQRLEQLTRSASMAQPMAAAYGTAPAKSTIQKPTNWGR
jgi:hypothetical protein